MSEQDSQPEITPPPITREQVINAFQPFIAKGITNPDLLPPNDPEAISAERLLDSWREQQEKESLKIGTPAAELEFSVNSTTLLVDAGFSAPEYLDEVAGNFLLSDWQRAQKIGSAELASKIITKMNDINAKIPPSAPTPYITEAMNVIKKNLED